MSPPSGYFQNLRPEMIPFLPDDYARVLEIGCGEGRFSDNLKSGSEVWGIEPDGDALAAAPGKLHRVLAGRYEDVHGELPESHFDLVICNDVIEHMEDHDRFFRSIRSKIAPGGSLVASIPNVRYVRNLFRLIVRKEWEYEDDGVLDRTHLRFFTEKSLKRCLIRHGFEIAKFGGINRSTKAAPVALLSLGYCADVQFLQFGFRAVSR